MEPFPSFGGAAFSPHSKKVIRLILTGCVNRPFFHISVQEQSECFKYTTLALLYRKDVEDSESVMMHSEKMIKIVISLKKEKFEPVIEQIGNYDPLPNSQNEKLVAINFQRLEHWLREGALVTHAVRKLLGLSGYFPVHPDSMKDAFRRRKNLMNEIQKLKIEAAKFAPKAEENSSTISKEE